MNNILLTITIFLGSFVSFALEPMIGRALLPVFGGTPMVWVTCLACFQLLMVAGYFYAERCGTGRHLIRHLVLIGLAGAWCCALHFVSGPVLDGVSGLTGVAAFDVLLSVLVLVGFAFVLLSANATLVQNLSGGNYRLYAVSNLGSFLGLFAYPILVEPFVGLSFQWLLLGLAIFLYTIILAFCSRTSSTPNSQPSTLNSQPSTHNSKLSTAPLYSAYLYLAIPACSCALLNAVTTHLTLDILPLPLLWAVLLGLFLLSYVIGFSGWGKSVWWAVPAAGSAIFAYWWLRADKGNAVADQLGVAAALLFFVCTFLHSWLYELRPDKERLGRYYLFNVIGGAVGGSSVAILAPLLFTSVVEYPIMICASAAAVVVWMAFRWNKKVAGIALILAVVACALAHLQKGPNDGDIVIHKARGFFGTIRVEEVRAGSSDGQPIAIHEFYHGETMHGIQVMRPEMQKMPTCYFTPYGCGFAIWGHPSYTSGKPMRVNLIGMGMGVLFSYAREGDYYRAYEISPETIAAAKDMKLFRFYANCPASKEIVPGDARKGIEKELADGVEPYDVIVVDAFTGDSIPYHLSTKEAIEIYLKLLKPDGILCIHFSNKHLDLKRYIQRIGLDFGMKPIVLKTKDDGARLSFATDVAFFTRTPEKLRALPITDGHADCIDYSHVKPMSSLPTDDKGSFLPLVHFR